MSAPIKVIFLDIGGVILSNGWDRVEREHVVAKFQLDAESFRVRHDRVVPLFDCGKISLSQYLDEVVFHMPRDFSPESFKLAMFEASVSLPGSLEWLRGLRKQFCGRIFSLNNESRELHEYRIDHFSLRDSFDGFLASCYLGISKPDRGIYEQALGIVACRTEEVCFIDDRLSNIEAASAVGIRSHQFHDPSAAQTFLESVGV